MRIKIILIILILGILFGIYYCWDHSDPIVHFRLNLAIKTRDPEKISSFTTCYNPTLQALAVGAIAEIGDESSIRILGDVIQNNKSGSPARIRSITELSKMNSWQAKECLINAFYLIEDRSLKYFIAAHLFNFCFKGSKCPEGITQEEVIKKWEDFWNENKHFVYWSQNDGQYIIDDEAKQAGIPTKGYRLTHPWGR